MQFQPLALEPPVNRCKTFDLLDLLDSLVFHPMAQIVKTSARLECA